MIELKNVNFTYTSESEELFEENNVSLNKSIGGSLHDIDLTIADGSFVLLTGPSGCGKTTILRLINGLIPRYYPGKITGEILIDNDTVSDKELYETAHKTGTVFQNPRSQFFNVDTTSELAFACENQGMNAEKIKQRIEKTVDIFKIEKLMDRNIFKLSDGEKQKIACASIDVGRPQIILLDEPSANLDYQAAMQLRKLIEIWKHQGKTIVAAEHRISYLWDLIDRAVIMRSGRIVKDLMQGDLRKLSDDEITNLGLRTVHFEKPTEIQLPEIMPDDEKMNILEFYFSYKKSLFERNKNIREIIHIENLPIAVGKITAVVGENGSGKTTFLHCLCGLEKRCKGIVEYKAKIYNRRKRQNLMFMVMQDVNHQLFTESALEEVIISLPNGNDGKNKERALDILKKVDLDEYADRHPMSLSGGQKQRLAVACAIASEREILLFDEPTSGLDYIHMEQTAQLLRELKAMGKTIIVVTHDSELIHSCCDRKLVIK